MIEFLKITSMAIFDELEIEFTPGLNCITGETGAGKSLLLDALTLLMGARAGRELIRPNSGRMTIEALFNMSGKEKVLRREVYPSGSGRCFIDGRLVTASALAEASSDMIHIYGQHEYQDLLSPKQHMRILEELSGLSRDKISSAYKEYENARSHLLQLERNIESFRNERDNLEFSLQELNALPLEEGLESRLVQELEIARAAAELRESAMAAQEIIYSGTPSMTDLAAEARNHISRMVHHDPGMAPLLASMDNLIVQIEDAHLHLRSRSGQYEHDPERISALEEQLNTLREVMRKHRLDEAGLLRLKDELMHKLTLLEDSGQNTSAARNRLDEAFQDYRSLLDGFLKRRMESGKAICKQINRDLKDLGMPSADFALQQLEDGHLDEVLLDQHGIAASPAVILKGEFLISTNRGHVPLPLAKIASGGELSRIMLAIKVQQRTHADSTLIFDEIDSGISGQTAIAIASKLKDLSSHAQAIVVTHLHQVASAADTHFVITKSTGGSVTSSSLKKLESKDRVCELARMMGGDAPSSVVLKHARELIREQEKSRP
jgi:DNA repair protein RecN (Recombination protein N)